MEEERGINSDITVNPFIVPFIKTWAETSQNGDNRFLWSDMVNTMTNKNIIRDEGDFLKKINFTVNILKQIKKAAPSTYLKETSEKAIKMLQKSPVNDILLYELDYKEANE